MPKPSSRPTETDTPAKRLRYALYELNISISEAAEAIGVHYRHFQSYLSGRSPVSEKRLFPLLVTKYVSIKYIFHNIGTPKATDEEILEALEESYDVAKKISHNYLLKSIVEKLSDASDKDLIFFENVITQYFESTKKGRISKKNSNLKK